MCGIAGYVAFPGCDRSTLSIMAQAIAHRGPDDEAIWTTEGAGLAYRRLAIIDLSPAGNQPVVSHCGRYVMVYNGEIYNYVELRRELEALGVRFRGQSDSEVLLAAYVQWGEAGVSRFNGMWAFAIWDQERKRLFASRDRFGKKPFYYHARGPGMLFASEVKALLATRKVRAVPDLKSIAD
ncbi:MAG TPA: asparagine synthetase B, partial [Usitatibacter sp.]